MENEDHVVLVYIPGYLSPDEFYMPSKVVEFSSSFY